ncbi:MAG: TIGR04255 family protein [Clostridia bacterium]|nr:TIGR04255 family protein [Clostridia bacterium]
MEKVIYKRNFLKNVIFRVDFLLDEREFENLMSKTTLDEIKRRFEILEPLQTIQNTNFMVDVNTRTINANQNESKKYIFRKKEGTAALIIDSQSIVIDYTRYSDSEMLLEDIRMLNFIFSKISISRVGLRYINYIEPIRFGEIDWDRYIDESIRASQKIDFEGSLLQSINVTDIKYEDYIIKFQSGIHNQNFPADRIKDAYVLDFDASSNEIKPTEDIEQMIKKWNIQINKLFEKFIKPDFREILNGNSEL